MLGCPAAHPFLPLRCHSLAEAVKGVIESLEALSRTTLGAPRASGERQARSVPLAARRSAVELGTDA